MSNNGLLMAVHMATLGAGAVEPLPALEVDAKVECIRPAPPVDASDNAVATVECCCS